MNILLSLWYYLQIVSRKINWLIYKDKVTLKGKAYLNFGLLIIGMNNKDQVILGKNVDLYGCLSVGKKGQIIIGDYTCTSRGSMIQALSKIEIGKFTQIAPDVLIYDSNHLSIYARDRMVHGLLAEKGISSGNEVTKPIKIGNHVWIGRRAMIFKGVTIGDRSIIAAGAIVTHDVPPDSVVAGNPAKVVKNIDQEPIDPDEVMIPEEVAKMGKVEVMKTLEKFEKRPRNK